MKRILSSIAVCALIFAAASCNKVNPIIDPDLYKGVAVLNNGNWGDNNASITIYNYDSQRTSECFFEARNGQKLGDLGQDWIAVGDRIYIAVCGSRIIFETDKDFRITGQIQVNHSSALLSPRSLATDGKYIYVTYQEGYLGRIDASSLHVDITEVGPNPEGVAVAGGKIYVANSGGYLPSFDNTLSVVDAASFKEVKKITVNTNPDNVLADPTGKYVYVSSKGNYADIPSKLQAIKTADESVSDLEYTDITGMAIDAESLYVLCGGYDEFWQPLPGTIYLHDATANKACGKFSETTVENAYSISADKSHVFVGSSDYKTNGDIHVFGPDGFVLYSFDTNGLNPQMAMMY